MERLAHESKDKPTATLSGEKEKVYEGVKKGAYVISEAKGLVLATGSEVPLALAAQKELEKEGLHVSVVSIPSRNRFEEQSKEYKESVIPPHLTARLAIELGTSFGWREYIGGTGGKITIDHFGASTPAGRLRCLRNTGLR